MRLMVVFCLALVGTIAVVMNACDNVRLSVKQVDQSSSQKAIGEICSAQPEATKNYTKIMFLVDKSGSNDAGQYPDGSPYPGSDPDDTFRFDLINEYIEKHKTNDELMWGMIAFENAAGIAYINGQNDQVPIFVPYGPKVSAALTRLKVDIDEGKTPYRGALNMAMQAITNDRTQSAEQGLQPTYVVVLITDGAPSDYMIGSSNLVDEGAIDADVQSLTGTDTTLSTVYYGVENSQTSSDRLQRMARIGGGKYSNMTESGKVPIDSLIKFGTTQAWRIKRFVVTNLNASPCEDGTVDADSDADGLCDKDEIAFNEKFANDPTYSQRMGGKFFDPQNRNSFNPVYNDLIYYRRIVYGEVLDTSCTDTSDEDQDLLNYCEERFIKSNTPSGPTVPWSQAMKNDADEKNPDSDGDGFLDFHEFVFALGRQTAEVLSFASPLKVLTGGYSMEQVLQEHRNPRQPALAEPYDGKFDFSHVNPDGQNCYTYEQQELPLVDTKELLEGNAGGRTKLAHREDENVIMIYFIQTSEAYTDGPGELRFLLKKIKKTDPKLDFNYDIGLYESYLANKARVSPTRNVTE